MRASWAWLSELVDSGLRPEEAAQRLTMAGLEVEAIFSLGSALDGVVVAEVRGRRPHPRAEKLSLVTLWDGAETVEVVCGAPNVPPAGDKVLWVRPGARLADGREVAVRTIQGVTSAGLIPSAAEVGVGDDTSGVLVLVGEDATAAPGTAAARALGQDDVVFEVNVTPNRGDCLGHLGIARELAAQTGAKLRRPEVGLDAFVAPIDLLPPDIAVEDEAGCPRYTARTIAEVAMAKSPRWMRRRLEAVGVRPLSNVVDVTNYVMLELGQPLHAFDLDRLAGRLLRVRPARDGESMRSLDGEERTLAAGDLVIADAKGAVAIAGVMGGAGSEVSAATSRVLLESACFAPSRVRRTARRLGLATESSHRFERGVDPGGVAFASARAARLLCELAGGKVAAGEAGFRDVYPRPATPVAIDLRFDRARAVLGLDLGDEEMLRHLRALELCATAGPRGARVSCPTFRADLVREVDLIEEIARLAGYDRLPVTLPVGTRAPSRTPDHLVETVRDALGAAGLLEAITFGFTSPARLDALRFPAGHPATRTVTIVNPLGEDQRVMRTSLVANLLAALARNLSFGVTNVRLFEIGSVFRQRPGRLPDEPCFASGVLAGERAGWLKPDGAVDFFDVKGVVERVFAALHVVADFAPGTPEEAFLHPGVAATIVIAGECCGVVGEVHPETRERLGIDTPCFAFELDMTRLPPVAPSKARQLARFPAVARDVSFFVDERTPAARVHEFVRALRLEILESVAVLDDYRAEGKVPAGKKGMLWSMTYRASDRTLTDAEVDRVHEALVARLLSSLCAERR